ncbi:MAG: ABC transporter permease [Spirochaetota bacterium]
MVSIALRNLRRHAGHTILLACLTALSSFLFISGNSFLGYTNRTLRELFIRSITGDFALAARSDQSLSVFGANTPAIGELVPIPTLPQSREITQRIRELSEVKAVTPLVSGFAVMDGIGRRHSIPLFGIEPTSYFSVVDDITLVRGRRLDAGERGIMLTESHLERLEAQEGASVEMGHEVLLTTGRDTRFRIRGVPLVGVFRYPVSLGPVEDVGIVDATTLRALNSIQVRMTEPSSDETGPRNAAELDSLFGEDAESAEPSASDATAEAEDGAGISADDVLDRVRRTDTGRSFEGGPAHFLLVRGEETATLRAIAAEGGAEILSWRQAAGQSALLARLLQLLFNGGYVLFVLAVTLGATNIVLISTNRRAREIGTLRALGTEDGTIRRLFLLEYGTVSATGWALGLSGALVLSRSLSTLEFTVDNQLLTMLLGGSTLTFPVSLPGGILALALSLIISAVAVLFPLRRIMRRPIVEAIRYG